MSEQEIGYMPEYNEGVNTAFNAFLMEIEERLEIFKRAMLGMKKNANYGLEIDGVVDLVDWVKEKDAAMVNQKGAISIYNRLSMQVSKVTRSTNLTEEQISKQMIFFVETFGDWVISNLEDWDLREEHFENLLEQAQDIYFMALNSSKQGFLTDMLTRGYSSSDSGSSEGEEQNKMFGMPFGLGGKGK